MMTYFFAVDLVTNVIPLFPNFKCMPTKNPRVCKLRYDHDSYLIHNSTPSRYFQSKTMKSIGIAFELIKDFAKTKY